MTVQSIPGEIPAELHTDWDPAVSPDLEHPELFYDRVREAGGIAWSSRAGAWVVTRYDLITRIARDTETFSSCVAAPPLDMLPADLLEILAEAGDPGKHVVQADPPDHGPMRALGSQVMKGKVIDNAIPYMRATAAELIGSWGESVEFVAQFSSPYVHRVLNKLIGVEDDDMERVDAWNNAFLGLMAPTVPHEVKKEFAHQFVDYNRYLTELLERRRREPRDDMASAIVQVYEEGGASFTESLPDLRMFLRGLWAGGIHTTKDLITSCVYTLLGAQDRAPWLEASGKPELIPSYIDEVLRLLAPHRGLTRLATRNVDINGVEVQQNQQVMLLFGAGNLDPQVFSEPDQFVPNRANIRDHLAFGHGIHRCMGRVLARKESVVALEELVCRAPDVRIAAGYEPDWAPEFYFRGLRTLDLKR